MNILFILGISEGMRYGVSPKIEQALNIISSIIKDLEPNDYIAIMTFEIFQRKFYHLQKLRI